jgi:hypothetical protein
MVKLDFQSEALEKVFRNWKWSRNNTVLLFEQLLESENNNTDVLHQFQCVITTGDSYFRKLSGHHNEAFGILIIDEVVTPKKDISTDVIHDLLPQQIKNIEHILTGFDEDQALQAIGDILALSNHEYLHQGQLIYLFQQEKIEFPERFARAWAL